MLYYIGIISFAHTISAFKVHDNIIFDINFKIIMFTIEWLNPPVTLPFGTDRSYQLLAGSS